LLLSFIPVEVLEHLIDRTAELIYRLSNIVGKQSVQHKVIQFSFEAIKDLVPREGKELYSDRRLAAGTGNCVPTLSKNLSVN
jgi:hypothetical protein